MDNKEYADATPKGDRAGSRSGKSSDRQTFEKVFRDEDMVVGGSMTLTIVIEGGKVVRLRARDANGKPYRIGFNALFADKSDESLLDHHSHGGHHGGGGDDDDDDDGDECVKCDATGYCQVVKCKH
jgi:hypothetical protein